MITEKPAKPVEGEMALALSEVQAIPLRALRRHVRARDSVGLL